MSKPNNIIIETTAISHLKLQLNKCRMLKPNISENDKGVSWDGTVEVYSAEEFSKKTLRGIVPIQVKGTWYEVIPTGNTITYQAEVDDLKNYQKDGGTIFFVICCNETNYGIYYNALLPYDLDQTLKNITTKTKAITLHKLNNSTNDIYGTFSDFIYHKKRQSQRDNNIVELFAENKLDLSGKRLSLGYGGLPNPSEAEMIEYILAHPAYMYIKPEGFDIDVVLSKIHIDKIGKTIHTPVIYEGEVLFSDIHEVYSKDGKDSKKIKIGNNIVLDPKSEKVSMNFSSTLDERIRDMKFILWCSQNNKDEELMLTLSDGLQLTKQDVVEAVDYFEKIKQALSAYNVSKTFDFSKVGEGDYRKIQAFIDSTLEQKEVPYCINGHPGVGIFEFANIALLVCCMPGKISNMYFLKNMFEVEGIGVKYEIIDSDDEIWMSPYLDFKAEQFAVIDNFDAVAIKKSIIQFIPDSNDRYNGFYKEQINKCVLEILAAYDLSKKKELLDLADTLLDVLMNQENDEISNAIYRINKLQIHIRNGIALTTKEISETVKYKIKFVDNTFLQLCCNIILKEFDEADDIYNKFTKKQKEEFGKFPIMHLWNK